MLSAYFWYLKAGRFEIFYPHLGPSPPNSLRSFCTFTLLGTRRLVKLDLLTLSLLPLSLARQLRCSGECFRLLTDVDND